MLGTSITRHIRGAASRFVGANQGNIAVIFAIALLPLISFVGAAIDYSRLNAARSSMQSALDSTALMVSKDLNAGVITTSQIQTTAQIYFTALYTDKDATVNPVTATYTAGSGTTTSTVLLTGTGSIMTDFMKVVGFPTLNFNTSSTATWGNVKMRVALALDNTGSMSDEWQDHGAEKCGRRNRRSHRSAQRARPRLGRRLYFGRSLRQSRQRRRQQLQPELDRLDRLAESADRSSRTTEATQATLPMNWHAVGPGAKCPFTTSSGGFTCTSGPTSTSNASTIPSSGTYSGYICPSVDANSHTLYNGCWVSTPATPSTGVFCSGSSSCACPVDSPIIMSPAAAAPAAAAASRAPAIFIPTTGRSPVPTTQHII